MLRIFKQLQNSVFMLFLVSYSFVPVHAESMEVSVFITASGQRTFFTNKIKEFEEKTGTSVRLIAKEDADYKALMKKWFAEKSGPDVIHWQGGERLFRYARRGQLQEIDDLWQQRDFSNRFTPSAIDAVSYQGKHYAIPISYYQWGFYYRKSLFSNLGLSPPQNWNELLHVCNVLKREGIEPITLGVKNKWPSAAWFDYINLRINGLQFHRSLLTGNISYHDERVRKVFSAWRELITNQCFVKRNIVWNWKQALPFLYHKKSGITLIGNFFAGQLPEMLKEDFAFSPFPVINPNIPNYEEAPLDLFMIPKHSKHPKIAEEFLKFVASEPFQTELNIVQGTISPNKKSPASNDYFIQQGSSVLEKAAGVSQFFDRDTNAKMAELAIGIFTDFLQDPNIDRTLKQLEEARRISFNL